ncbi:Heat shock protein HtpX (Metallo peptidase, MEROPS family M48B) [Methanocella conradii HZ254]|uniref:Protease HtpX homolog n=1 Tax=Methanocella conradii (strain DSM 24694 / JCM 17849 / CGMCC 1.5162 / HZ254) TaxID=1041930 RepID=H8I7M2_METCZ|nr:M48 family metalloprotease [Methanocella conradii]AFC99857.1 Heat shock protein HtpX (Metallo peptidase, MEROPS family M48B) [Methanocella conradii HZ254]
MVIDWGMTIRKIIVYGALFMLFMIAIGFLVLMGVNAYLIALMAGGFLFIQYFFSDKLVLWSTGARILEENEAPRLHSIVENLAAEMDIPKPKVAVVQNDIPNAFATGRDKRHAVVAVTTGILNRLNEREMRGVLAHELSHIKNRDMFVVTFASFIVSIVSYVVYFVFAMLFSRDERNYGASMLAWLVSMLFSNTIGVIIINTVSRYREYGADRGSALTTRDPDALISALRKISGGDYNREDAMGLESAKALCISPIAGSVMELLSTHPSIEKRIAYLERIKSEL